LRQATVVIFPAGNESFTGDNVALAVSYEPLFAGDLPAHQRQHKHDGGKNANKSRQTFLLHAI
jgi:hypothetical protein